MKIVVSVVYMKVEDSSKLGSSIIAIRISLSPITLTCWSVSGPGRSNLSAFLTDVWLGQYSIVHLVLRYPPILSSWVNGIGSSVAM